MRSLFDFVSYKKEGSYFPTKRRRKAQTGKENRRSSRGELTHQIKNGSKIQDTHAHTTLQRTNHYYPRIVSLRTRNLQLFCTVHSHAHTRRISYSNTRDSLSHTHIFSLPPRRQSVPFCSSRRYCVFLPPSPNSLPWFQPLTAIITAFEVPSIHIESTSPFIFRQC